MEEARKLRIECPDCGSRLVVDAETGQVLAHEKRRDPLAGGATLDSLMEEMEAEKNRAEDVFEREKAALEHRDRLLEEKFREAMNRADDDEDTDETPLRPFDLD